MTTDQKPAPNPFDEYDRELEAHANSPEALAEDQRLIKRNRAKSETEFNRGIRLGWWDEDGNPLNVEVDEDDEDEGEDE